MLKHFKKGFSGDYGIKMSPGRLHTLCELEWLTFQVNWPLESTLDLPTVRAIYQIIIGNPQYPNQFPYIDSWLQVAQTMPLGSNSVPTEWDRAEFLWPRQ
jgi:hypothetical protein